MRRIVIPLTLLSIATTACGPKSVRVDEFRGFPEDPGLALFVVASRHKPRIVASLDEAGFQIADDLLETPSFLRVTVGVDKGMGSCGTLANVKYALRYEGAAILELRAAGWLGDCAENVFDTMSRRLMMVFKDTEKGEEEP